MIPVLRSHLSAEERSARHRLIVRDTVALTSLLTIVIALTFVTYLLFHSFAAHRLRLEQRWKARGEAALSNHQPLAAIDSLRSALAYAPDDRTLQIELASALAAAGRTQEAVVYFTTLHESEPGNGMINVQLARLSVIEGNVPLAITQYQAALDGTWNGDGVLRRRQVRLELSRYLIAQKRYDEARGELLIAAGNAADNHALQLTVGALLEQAEGEADAYRLYRKAMAFADTRTAGMVGAGRTAATQSRYLLARNLLQQASAQPDFSRLPEDERTAVRSLLAEAVAILDVFPAENMPPHVRAVRVMHAVQVLRAQIAACGATGASGGLAALTGSSQNSAQSAGQGPSQLQGQAQPQAPAETASSDKTAANKGSSLPKQPDAAQSSDDSSSTEKRPGGPIRAAINAVQRAGNSLARVSPAEPAQAADEAQASADAHVATLLALWHQLPPDDALSTRMEREPALLESTLQLIYELERAEAQSISIAVQGAGEHVTLAGCVPPSHDAALLMKIAAAPDEIEQQ